MCTLKREVRTQPILIEFHQLGLTAGWLMKLYKDRLCTHFSFQSAQRLVLKAHRRNLPMHLGMTIHDVSQRQASTLHAAITFVDQMVELLAANWQVGHQRNRALFGVSTSINFQPLAYWMRRSAATARALNEKMMTACPSSHCPWLVSYWICRFL